MYRPFKTTRRWILLKFKRRESRRYLKIYQNNIPLNLTLFFIIESMNVKIAEKHSRRKGKDLCFCFYWELCGNPDTCSTKRKKQPCFIFPNAAFAQRWNEEKIYFSDHHKVWKCFSSSAANKNTRFYLVRHFYEHFRSASIHIEESVSNKTALRSLHLLCFRRSCNNQEIINDNHCVPFSPSWQIYLRPISEGKSREIYRSCYVVHATNVFQEKKCYFLVFSRHKQRAIIIHSRAGKKFSADTL